MTEYNFNVEFITPLFMSGANQNDRPELRAPSIKGAMRFWFRAMMGKVLNDDVNKLKLLEGNLFGHANEGNTDIMDEDNGVKSKASDIGIEISRIKVNVNTNKINTDFSKYNRGVTYLSFPFLDWNNGREDYDVIRSFIDIKSSYKLKLTRILGKDDTALEVAAACVWLLANMGNVGSRSRRGFGSFRVTDVTGDDTNLNFTPPGQHSELKRYYGDNLKKIEEIFIKYAKKIHPAVRTTNTGKAPADAPEFDSFSCWKGYLLVNNDKGWNSWKDALNFIGGKLRETREAKTSNPVARTRTTDYIKCVRNYLKNFPLTDIDLENDIFGLPNQIRSASLKATTIITWRTKAKKAEAGDRRRASPLLIKPVLCGKKYYLLLHYFQSMFLPDDAQEIIRPLEKGWPPGMQMPQEQEVTTADYAKLEEFVCSLKGIEINAF